MYLYRKRHAKPTRNRSAKKHAKLKAKNRNRRNRAARISR